MFYRPLLAAIFADMDAQSVVLDDVHFLILVLTTILFPEPTERGAQFPMLRANDVEKQHRQQHERNCHCSNKDDLEEFSFHVVI